MPHGKRNRDCALDDGNDNAYNGGIQIQDTACNKKLKEVGELYSRGLGMIAVMETKR